MTDSAKRARHGLDDLDVAILSELQTDARITHAELARRLNLSGPAIHQRVKRLERQGFVRRVVALLDRELLGQDLMCFVHVAMQAHHRDRLGTFRETAQRLPEVLECHHLTGEYDFLLKVLAPDRPSLERLLVEKLSTIPGVGRLQTSVVLSEVKHTTAIPIE